MDAGLNLFDNPAAVKFVRYVNSAGSVVSEPTLPAVTQEPVQLRASQINGCGFRTDMHSKDAAHAGESPLRQNLVAALARGDRVHRGRARRAGSDRTGTRVPTRPAASPMKLG